MQPIYFTPPSHLDEWMERGINAIYRLIEASHPIILTASGGKDSTLTAIMGLEAIRRANIAGIAQPPHYITSADTTIENPAMLQHLLRFLDDIETHCESLGLGVEVRIAKPALASQFVVSTIGRGTLARTVQNSVKDGKGKRPCSDDWKVRPQNKLKKELQLQASREGFREPVTILGMRFAESAVRASRMTERGETASEMRRSEAGDLTFSPIADLETDDVWWMLSRFTDETQFPFPSPVSARTINRMHELYRDANEGTCGVVLGDGGYRAACSSRFGCSLCLISGDQDKSMESMIREPKHAHLAGLNRFRNYLAATQWDLSLRELVGRTISPAGYLRVQADTYSFEHRMQLLRCLLTLDILEIERAENHTQDLHSGLIDDNEANRELCDIQFEMINPQQLVAIDFQLGLHHYCPHAFPALWAWYEVRELGRRYQVPTIAVPRTKQPIPLHGWYKVNRFNAEVPTDGLRSYGAELWNPYRHSGRPSCYAQTPEGERVCYFEEDESFSVDAIEANTMVTCSFERMAMEVRSLTGLESSRFWLNEAIIRLPKGKAGVYNHMAKRGQYFANLAHKLNVSPDDLDEHLKRNAISNSAHDSLLAALAKENLPLFEDLADITQQEGVNNFV